MRKGGSNFDIVAKNASRTYVSRSMASLPGGKTLGWRADGAICVDIGAEIEGRVESGAGGVHVTPVRVGGLLTFSARILTTGEEAVEESEEEEHTEEPPKQ